MKFLNILLIFVISLSQIFSLDSMDLTFSKNEPVELEDLCLRRPYYWTAEPGYFVPILRAKMKAVGEKYSFSSRCFAKNIVSFKEMSRDKIVLSLENSGKEDTWCSELFIFHTSDHNFLQFVVFEGYHEIVLKRITQDDKDEIKVNGIKLYGFCNGLVNTVKSLFQTLKAFYGGLGVDPNNSNPRFRPNIPKDMEKANLRILDLYSHFTPERRNNTIVNFDKKTIHSGDFLLINRMDGLDPLIMLGSGGRSGHSAVCSWIDDELYVLESQSGWYWPRDGIQKNKWDDWVKWAHAADFNVVLLPIREEYRKKFNNTKALEWYHNEVEGLNYGYHNFISTWIDTPDKNFPFITTSEIAEFIFSIVSKVYPPASDLIMTENVNIRLGKKGLTFQQAIAEGARQGKSLEEILAEPEPEGVEYSDGLNYVCSCFVVAFWKHGGMFGDLDFSPNEFGPKDIYMLDIFDKNVVRPQECIDDNPDLPYCQVMGKFIIELEPGRYSSITPYAHMNERCSSQAPDFIREEGC
jgi:hypothetical protein